MDTIMTPMRKKSTSMTIQITIRKFMIIVTELR
jgi:hypothetical protein